MQPAAIGLDLLMPEPDGASPCTAAGYIPDIAPDLAAKLCELPSNDALLATALKDARAAGGMERRIAQTVAASAPGGAAPYGEAGSRSR